MSISIYDPSYGHKSIKEEKRLLSSKRDKPISQKCFEDPSQKGVNYIRVLHYTCTDDVTNSRCTCNSPERRISLHSPTMSYLCIHYAMDQDICMQKVPFPAGNIQLHSDMVVAPALVALSAKLSHFIRLPNIVLRDCHAGP